MSCPPPDPVFCLQGSAGSVTSLFFPGQENRLLSGDLQGNIYAWNLTTNRIEWQKEAHKSTCLWIGGAEGKLVTQGRYESVKIWACRGSNLDLDWEIESQCTGFCQCDFVSASDGLLLSPGPEKDEFSVTALKGRTTICSLPAPTESYGTVMAAKFAQGGGVTRCLAAYESGHVVLWDWANRKPMSVLQVHEGPMCIAYDSSRSQGMCAGGSDYLDFFSCQGGTLEAKEALKITNAGVACASIRRDSKLMVTGGWDGRLRVFAWKCLKPLAVLDSHQETVECIAYAGEPTPSATHLLAAGSKDRAISLWKIYDGT